MAVEEQTQLKESEVSKLVNLLLQSAETHEVSLHDIALVWRQHDRDEKYWDEMQHVAECRDDSCRRVECEQERAKRWLWDHWLDWKSAKLVPTPDKYKVKRPGQAYRAGDDWSAEDVAWVVKEHRKPYLGTVRRLTVDIETGMPIAIIKPIAGPMRTVQLDALYLESPIEQQRRQPRVARRKVAQKTPQKTYTTHV